MIFEKLTELFLKFPGIGPRQARRFAYFLTGENKEFADALAEAILEIKKDARQCPSCFRFFEQTTPGVVCQICSSPNRDSSLLMVVEKNIDLDNLEKTGAYNGKYFILGGTLSLNGKSLPVRQAGNASELKFKELFKKIQTEKPKEIILALSATLEGENTARYVDKILEPLRQAQGKLIKITRLGRGLSTGTELEYIDSETLNSALKNRN